MKKINQPSVKVVHDESGVAAIMITMVIMSVIGLIVLGFATISQREQRQTLDKQLQTQAFYAAESGVNDALSIIQSAPAGTPLAKTSCANTGTYSPLEAQKSLGGAGTGVSYSCVLVESQPTSLKKDGVTDTSPWTVQAKTATGAAPAKYVITWSPSAASGNPTVDCAGAAANVYKPAAEPTNTYNNKCKYPVLRVSLVELADGISNDVNKMNGKQFTYIFQPVVNGAGATTLRITNGLDTRNPAPVLANCTGGSYGRCSVTINTSAAPNDLSPNMALLMTSLYGESEVTLQALNSSDTPLALADAQTVIDVTGKAQDVLRRIQVRIPMRSSIAMPGALMTNGPICKRYDVRSGYFVVDTGIAAELKGAGNPLNPLCG